MIEFSGLYKFYQICFLTDRMMNHDHNKPPVEMLMEQAHLMQNDNVHGQLVDEQQVKLFIIIFVIYLIIFSIHTKLGT